MSCRASVGDCRLFEVVSELRIRVCGALDGDQFERLIWPRAAPQVGEAQGEVADVGTQINDERSGNRRGDD